MREELITSAVSFLSDPKVQSAALAKKVSFLESKGLTPEEIEEAMARANGKAPTIAPASQGTMMISQPGMVSQSIAPPVPARPTYDWRDIFIAAMLAGGVGYGVWNLAKVHQDHHSTWMRGSDQFLYIIVSFWSMVYSANTETVGRRQGKIGCAISSR